MNATPPDKLDSHSGPQPHSGYGIIILILLACAAAAIAVSPQSLWIDEAETALKAIPPTLHGWWHALYLEHNTNMQLPLYMLYVWSWARIFGVTEFALRAANIPFFLLGFFAIHHFLQRHPRLRTAALLVYCVHPFVWFYLNEARPYIMQLSGALLVAGALFAALDEPAGCRRPSWWWLFAAGLFILCGAGIIGTLWAAAITLALIFRPGFPRAILQSGRSAIFIFAPLLAALAAYFAWTVSQKISTGYYGINNIPSMLSVFYDQLGFLGLGPGRTSLRADSLSALPPYIGPLSLLAIPLAAGLAISLCRRFDLAPRTLITILLITIPPVCLVFTVGFIRHDRILGRHLTPMFPFILLAESYALLCLWKNTHLIARGAAAIAIAALALSSLELRFAYRHSKDDYRTAAAQAAASLAAGQTVWWAADQSAAAYYHLPLNIGLTDVPGSALWLEGVPDRPVAPPAEIFLSKTDLFDPTGSVRKYIAAHHYHLAGALPAFTIWKQ